ncbi:Hypothetical predicted protein [Olea europaea subsp. europaea]|uniref:Uncharacterized protein n=1 Tax=Olea europaea subsp. europaea TaxID=158383 RepID=A0A8S0S4A4_OLEEU|nr:Hypothetical predicted protein [Olea europaea subsp. europaea]
MAMPHINGVQYKKPVQLKFSRDSHRDKSRIETSVGCAGVGSTQPNILHSEDIQKHVDLVILDVVTVIKDVDTEDTPTVKPTSRSAKILWSPFVAIEGKLFKHDDIVVFENYKGHVDEVDSSAFMAWF